MTKLFFIRHGESKWNQEKRIQGQADIPLTDRGIEQANQIARRMEDEDIDLIYSSDLKRAFVTATTIADRKNMDVIVDERLREMSFGIWESMLMKDVEKTYSQDYLYWLSRPEILNIPEGETLETLSIRMMGVINEIVEKNKGKNIAIVSHGTAIKTVILSILGIPLDNYKNFSLDNTSLSVVEYKDYNPVLKVFNDISHRG